MIELVTLGSLILTILFTLGLLVFPLAFLYVVYMVSLIYNLLLHIDETLEKQEEQNKVIQNVLNNFSAAKMNFSKRTVPTVHVPASSLAHMTLDETVAHYNPIIGSTHVSGSTNRRKSLEGES